MSAWEHTPPQAVSLHWIRNMMAGFFGVEINDGPKPEPLPITPQAMDWMHEQIAEMGGMMPPEVFQALQEMEATCGK